MNAIGFSPDLFGYAAAIMTTSAFIPQVLKSWRTRDLSGVSLLMYSMTATGILFWLVYGVVTGNLPLIFANTITLSLVSIVLVLKLRQDNSAPPHTDLAVARKLLSWADDLDDHAGNREATNFKAKSITRLLGELSGHLRQVSALIQSDDHWEQQAQPTLRESTAGTCYD